MKKCPTCDKTFEDSMRFCQVDGTPLVDDAPAFDPYATIVAQPFIPVEPEDPLAIEEPVKEVEAEPFIHQTIGSMPIAEPEDVLDLPQNDPLKTMYVSDSEMQAALGTEEPAADIIEIPPIEEVSAPEPPSFIAPEFTAPPPSPFSMPESVADEPEPLPPGYEERFPTPAVYEDPAPASSMFNEAATMIQPSFNSPFDPAPPAPIAEWTPPPAPDASWQNQEIGANTPFQPPPAGVGGQSQGLAIASLVAGILSLLCCNWFVVGIAAVIMGFIAKSKADNSPNEYGGRGLALGGIITGAISFVLGILLWILYFFGALASVISNLN